MLQYATILFIIIFISFISQYNRNVIRKSKNLKLDLSFFPFLLFTILLGFRVGVGRDFPTYCTIYDTFSTDQFGSESRFGFEYGTFFILKIATFLNSGYLGYFLISAIFTSYFMHKALRDKATILPYAIIVIYLGFSWEFIINGTRQGIAMFASLAALKCIENIQDDNNNSILKSIIKYEVLVLVASMFHSSCLVVSIIPFLFRYVRLSQHKLFLVAMCGLPLGFILPQSIKDLAFLASMGEDFMYQSYLESDFMTGGTGLSLATLVSYCIYLLPLLFYDRIISIYPSFKVYFYAYAIGVFIYYIFPYNQLTQRISYYFLLSEIIVYGSWFASCKRLPNFFTGKLCAIIALCWYVLLFIYHLPSFFDLHIYNNATLLGIHLN